MTFTIGVVQAEAICAATAWPPLLADVRFCLIWRRS
jgi:hypothetical protein